MEEVSMIMDREKIAFVEKNAIKYIKSLYPDKWIVSKPTTAAIQISVYESNEAGSEELRRYYVFEDGSMNESLGKKYR
jgi:hypothetical protein